MSAMERAKALLAATSVHLASPAVAPMLAPRASVIAQVDALRSGELAGSFSKPRATPVHKSRGLSSAKSAAQRALEEIAAMREVGQQRRRKSAPSVSPTLMSPPSTLEALAADPLPMTSRLRARRSSSGARTSSGTAARKGRAAGRFARDVHLVQRLHERKVVAQAAVDVHHMLDEAAVSSKAAVDVHHMLADSLVGVAVSSAVERAASPPGRRETASRARARSRSRSGSGNGSAFASNATLVQKMHARKVLAQAAVDVRHMLDDAEDPSGGAARRSASSSSSSSSTRRSQTEVGASSGGGTARAARRGDPSARMVGGAKLISKLHRATKRAQAAVGKRHATEDEMAVAAAVMRAKATVAAVSTPEPAAAAANNNARGRGRGGRGGGKKKTRGSAMARSAASVEALHAAKTKVQSTLRTRRVEQIAEAERLRAESKAAEEAAEHARATQTKAAAAALAKAAAIATADEVMVAAAAIARSKTKVVDEVGADGELELELRLRLEHEMSRAPAPAPASPTPVRAAESKRAAAKRRSSRRERAQQRTPAAAAARAPSTLRTATDDAADSTEVGAFVRLQTASPTPPRQNNRNLGSMGLEGDSTVELFARMQTAGTPLLKRGGGGGGGRGVEENTPAAAAAAAAEAAAAATTTAAAVDAAMTTHATELRQYFEEHAPEGVDIDALIGALDGREEELLALMRTGVVEDANASFPAAAAAAAAAAASFPARARVGGNNCRGGGDNATDAAAARLAALDAHLDRAMATRFNRVVPGRNGVSPMNAPRVDRAARMGSALGHGNGSGSPTPRRQMPHPRPKSPHPQSPSSSQRVPLRTASAMRSQQPQPSYGGRRSDGGVSTYRPSLGGGGQPSTPPRRHRKSPHVTAAGAGRRRQRSSPPPPVPHVAVFLGDRSSSNRGCDPTYHRHYQPHHDYQLALQQPGDDDVSTSPFVAAGLLSSAEAAASHRQSLQVGSIFRLAGVQEGGDSVRISDLRGDAGADAARITRMELKVNAIFAMMRKGSDSGIVSAELRRKDRHGGGGGTWEHAVLAMAQLESLGKE